MPGPDTDAPPPDDLPASIRGRVVRGSALMIAARWAVRLLGLTSTIILARLLTPADFGLVAMAMLVVGLIEILSETAVDMALIRHANPQRAHFDSAWTIAVLVSAGLAALLNLIAEPVALYFNEPRAAIVIQLLSIKTFLIGFENIGTVWFRRNLDFASEFKFVLARKVVPAVITVTLAFWLRDYRALVYGIVAGQIFTVGLSYVVHPYRPWISFKKVKELWSFSIWILVADVGQYLHGSIGRFVVGSSSGLVELGRFTIADELASLPKTEVIDPVSRALYPAYSKLTADPGRLRLAFLNVLSATAIIAGPAFAGIAITAHDMLWLILGQQWTPAAPLMVWLAVSTGLQSFGNSVFMVLNALGEARRTSALTWFRFAFLAAMLALFAPGTDVEGIAAMLAWGALLLLPLYFQQLHAVLPFRGRDIVTATWRPLAATCAMLAVLGASRLMTDDLAPPLRLLIEIPTGMAIYTAALIALWILSGKPEGSESAAFSLVRERWLKFRRTNS